MTKSFKLDVVENMQKAKQLDSIFGKINADFTDPHLKIVSEDKSISGGLKGRRVKRVFMNATCYDQSRDIIRMIFDNFDRIVCCFSTGKDSQVLLHMMCQEYRRRVKNPAKYGQVPKEKIILWTLDLECLTKFSVDITRKCLEEYKDCVEPFLIFMPGSGNTNLNQTGDGLFTWYEPTFKDKFVHPIPDYKTSWGADGCITLENQHFEFYNKLLKDGNPHLMKRYNDDFDAFYKDLKDGKIEDVEYPLFETVIGMYNEWMSTHNPWTGELENAPKLTAICRGVKCSESPHRFRSVTNQDGERFIPKDKDFQIKRIMEERNCDEKMAATYLGFTQCKEYGFEKEEGVIWSVAVGGKAWALNPLFSWENALGNWVFLGGNGTKDNIPVGIRNAIRKTSYFENLYKNKEMPKEDKAMYDLLMQDINDFIEKYNSHLNS